MTSSLDPISYTFTQLRRHIRFRPIDLVAQLCLLSLIIFRFIDHAEHPREETVLVEEQTDSNLINTARHLRDVSTYKAMAAVLYGAKPITGGGCSSEWSEAIVFFTLWAQAPRATSEIIAVHGI